MRNKGSLSTLCSLLVATTWVGALLCGPIDGVTAATMTEDFSVDPGWTGSNNSGFGNNNYGFSNTNNAGGIAGEAGGAVASRTQEITYYADTSIGVLSQQEVLTASGLLTAVGSLAPFDGGFEFGWFDSTPPLDPQPGGVAVGGILDAVMMRFLDNNGSATSYRVQARLGDEGGLLVNLASDVDYKFDMTYDPNFGAPVNGRLRLEFRRLSDDVLVGTSTATRSSLLTPFALTGFGFTTLDFNSDRAPVNIFVDNLTYTVAVPEATSAVSACIAVIGMLLTRRRSGGAAQILSDLISGDADRLGH